MKRLIVLALLGPVLGVVGAKLWLWWWTPPVGVAFDHRFQQDALGLQHDFDGTGWYVFVVLILGAVIGLVGCFSARGKEIWTLGVALATSLLMSVMTADLGLRWGPTTPDARSTPDLTALRAGLSLDGHLVLRLLGPLATAGVLALGMLLFGGRNAAEPQQLEEAVAG